MKPDCAVIQDLLPLYIDGVCSDASRRLVEGHLAECPDCLAKRKAFEADCTESAVTEEKNRVLSRQKKAMERKSLRVGMFFALLFALPVLICLIVNVSVGNGMGWFFVVLTAMTIPTGLIAVPLLVQKYRFLSALVTATAGLLLLLFTCCTLNRGNWFTVAAASVLFGVGAVTLPIAVNCEPLKKLLKNHRLLTVFAALTALYVLMMVAIGAKTDAPDYGRLVCAISAPLLGFAWALMLICRYLPAPKALRAGIALFLTGAMAFWGESCILGLAGSGFTLPKLDLLHWSIFTIEDNLKWCALLAGVLSVMISILYILLRKKDRTK